MNVQLPDAASLQRTDAVVPEGREDPRARPRACKLHHDDRRLQPPRRSLGALHRLLLRRARALGRAQGRARCRSSAIVQRAERRASRADPGGERRSRSRRPPSRARHRRRLLVLAPGPQRRDRRVPGRRTSRSSWRPRASAPSSPASTASAAPSVPQIFADVDRDKVLKQGVADRRRLPDAAGVPRRHLREPVQPLRPPVEGLPAGRAASTASRPRTSTTSTCATTTARWCRSRRS